MVKIITDLSDTKEIYSRFDDELPRVHRWITKSGTPVIPYFGVSEGGILVNDRGTYTPYVMEGYIPWTSPKTGDTWAAAVLHKKSNPGRTCRISFYYWQTIGSIGFMIPTTLNFGNMVGINMITTYSSHTMLRYRDRLGLRGLSGFELILRIFERTFSNIPNWFTKDGKEQFELLCQDGVFIGQEDKSSTREGNYSGNMIRNIKTFLSWKDLEDSSPGLYKHLREKWTTGREQLYGMEPFKIEKPE